ncbi:MAG TPA: TIGR00730 family Rossman fold protein [Streptosporangiaceae bacterium]|nr:TIGR00730 family Rossman fold protein [Streptosporangiaceae bacterium]
MRVTVFLGSSAGTRPEYKAAAADLGTSLAAAGAGIVYGGDTVGLMGVLAHAALAAGGEVIGVIPRAMAEAGIADPGLTRLEVVDSMHARKARMAELGDAFVALPGGLGTLDELVEILTWRQLRLHGKRVALLDVGGFWEPLLALLDAQVAAGFVTAANRALLLRVTSPAAVLAALTPAGPPAA